MRFSGKCSTDSMSGFASIGYIDSGNFLAPAYGYWLRFVMCDRWIVDLNSISEPAVVMLARPFHSHQIVSGFQPVDSVNPSVISVGSIRPSGQRHGLTLLILHSDCPDRGSHNRLS